jgi:hypothetical protein
MLLLDLHTSPIVPIVVALRLIVVTDRVQGAAKMKFDLVGLAKPLVAALQIAGAGHHNGTVTGVHVHQDGMAVGDLVLICAISMTNACKGAGAGAGVQAKVKADLASCLRSSTRRITSWP